MNREVLLAYNPNDVKPGWIALILVIVLCLATVLLWRSMNAQLRKIQLPPKPPRPPFPQAPEGGATRDPQQPGDDDRDAR
jgi:hypothetical protein